MEPTLPAGQWLSVFATTNIYFHLSMAYAILRMKGVPIGKIDLFAGPAVSAQFVSVGRR